MNWYAADNHCRRLGGQLVEIGSPEENEAILGEIRKRGFPKKGKQFWMGLTDRGVSDNVDSLNKVHLLIKQCKLLMQYWGGYLRRCKEALAFVRSHFSIFRHKEGREFPQKRVLLILLNCGL